MVQSLAYVLSVRATENLPYLGQKSTLCRTSSLGQEDTTAHKHGEWFTHTACVHVYVPYHRKVTRRTDCTFILKMLAFDVQ